MKAFIKTLAIPVILILAMPVAGTVFFGNPLAPYLHFPPRPVYQPHAQFSPDLFVLGLTICLAFVFPFIIKGVRSGHGLRQERGIRFPLPWWGKGAGVGLIVFWILAWTRFSWFAPLQNHTFFPLWLMFIILVNGLTVKVSGTCPLTKRPKRFAILFLVSALFWWIFEYLNRFASNWYYDTPDYTPLTYCLLATLSFSTVLPAVASVQALLATRPVFRKGFSNFLKIGFACSRAFAFAALVLSSICLFLIGIRPDYLFFLVWIAPFVIIVSARTLAGEPTILGETTRGEWNQVVSHALSALVCGFFWEMWNYYSLAKWHYSIPFVHAVEIFEMPGLGYFGYLPFGLECALIIELVLNKWNTNEN